ncbi:MAG: hypothetical protein U0031_05665 [Thermomicrobiales bacterium]
MNLPELAAYVALIADDAEGRFGPEASPSLWEAYAHEAVLDLWLAQPGVTVATAHRMLHQLRTELRRRWNQRMEQQEEPQLAIEVLPAELGTSALRITQGNGPNARSLAPIIGGRSLCQAGQQRKIHLLIPQPPR